MEVKYDKTAVLDYIANFRNLQDLMRRDMDESLNKYNACKQEYSRIFTECEEESHRAYNRVMSAESEIQMADMMMEQAMASVSDSDDEDSQPDYDMINRAQEMRRQAEADLVVAQADYSRAQDNISKLNAVMEKYGPSLEAESKVVNDSFTECSIVGSKAGEALEQYVGVMDKAYSALYESSAPQGSTSGASGSSYSSGGSIAVGASVEAGGNAVADAGSIGANGGNNLASSDGRLNAGQGAVGNTIDGTGEVTNAQIAQSNGMSATGTLVAGAVTAGVVSYMIAGQKREFHNNKVGLSQAYKAAIKAGDTQTAANIKSQFAGMNNQEISSNNGNIKNEIESEIMKLSNVEEKIVLSNESMYGLPSDKELDIVSIQRKKLQEVASLIYSMPNDYDSQKYIRQRTNQVLVQGQQLDWYKGISDNQREAMKKYTGTYSGDMNAVLRRNKAVDDPEGINRLINDLHDSLKDVKTAEEVTVYRGASKAVLCDYKDSSDADIEGIFLRDKGFMSTSFDRNVAQGFAYENGSDAVLIEYNVPKGTHAIYLQGTSTCSSAFEEELLVDCKTAFRVDRVSHEDGLMILHATILLEDEDE